VQTPENSPSVHQSGTSRGPSSRRGGLESNGWKHREGGGTEPSLGKKGGIGETGRGGGEILPVNTNKKRTPPFEQSKVGKKKRGGGGAPPPCKGGGEKL